jgi:hypothetical protein
MTGSSGRGDNEPTPVVEPKPGETAPPATSRALNKRIRQQEILAEIGVAALQGGGFERLLAETVRLTADGMEAEFCKILEHIPDESRFLVRAGVGWEPGIVGKATVGVISLSSTSWCASAALRLRSCRSRSIAMPRTLAAPCRNVRSWAVNSSSDWLSTSRTPNGLPSPWRITLMAR